MTYTLKSRELLPEHGGAPKQLVVLLHGLGSNGNDLIQLAPYFAEGLADAAFLSPNAPNACDMGPIGYQWFSLREWATEKMREGADAAAPILNEYLDDALEQFGLNDSNLALVGFSQGTMMALHVGLARPNACAAILGYSGAYLNAQNSKRFNAPPPVCLIHGQMDPVVPHHAMIEAEEALTNLGLEVETHSRPMLAHSIDPEGIKVGTRFLNEKLA